MPSLVVISGPIASGKSTVAKLLAEEVRGRGRSAAVLDLDLIYEMLSSGGKSDETLWAQTREAAASFADSLLRSSVDVVIVEGEFWTDAHREPIRRLSQWAPRFVTLDLDVDTALQRAQHDPARVTSRDPAFLRPHYDKFDRVRSAFETIDLVVSTAKLSAADVAARVREKLLG